MHVKELLSVKGKVALITGGSRGLGKEMARGLGEAEAKVVLTARREEWLRPTEQEFKEAGFEVLALVGDVAKPEDAQQIMDDTLKTFGQLDILINNAGQSWGAAAEEMPFEKWQQVINANMTGTFLMSQAAAKYWIEQKREGVVINIASVAGLRGGEANVMKAVGYSASKGGIISMTRELAVEWGPYQIRVNAVAPGFFPTRMAAPILNLHGDKMAEATPLKRLGGDDDLKGLIVFLSSPASRHITGQTIAVDGGASV